jgi:hypothetical protein
MKSGLILVISILSFGFHAGVSQDPTASTSPLMFSEGMNANYGFVLAHSSKVEKTSNAFPVGLTASFNWQRTDRDDFDLYKCLPRHVLQVAYYNLDNSALGKGVNVSYALEPHFMLNRNVSVYPKFAGGLGFLSNPHDSIANPANRAYSLPVNVYLALGVGMRYQFSKHWAARLSAEFQHISNGGLYKPNIGINYPTLGVGVEFSPRGLELKKYESRHVYEKIRSRRLDVQLFGIMKYGDFSGGGSYYPIAGLNMTNSWQVGRINAWTAAAEIYQDQYLQEHNSAGGISSSGTRVGLLAGHEFLLGKFIFSQQIGIYLTDSQRQDMVYHRWGLQYYFMPRWSVGFNLLVHRQTADFTDIRVTYTIFKVASAN